MISIFSTKIKEKEERLVLTPKKKNETFFFLPTNIFIRYDQLFFGERYDQLLKLINNVSNNYFFHH